MPYLNRFLWLILCGIAASTQTIPHAFATKHPINAQITQAYLPFVSLDSSNLPIVIINTHRQKIVDEPDLIAQIKVIDNDTGNNRPTDKPTYEGNIAIEVRGYSSQSFRKKSYGFTTLDAQNTPLDTAFMGLPPENDWILHASYADKTLLRNALSMHIAQQMGYYASRTRHCEVLINGKYQGVYVLMEKIKRGKNRVNIAKIKPNSVQANDLTGGYIFKLDHRDEGGWNSDYGVVSAPQTPLHFQFVYPKYHNVNINQAMYLQAYVDSFEHALASPTFKNNAQKRYNDYIDLQSFADYFIVSELSRNLDAYRISTYFTKDKNQKIKAAPVWDYDLAWRNGDFCDAVSTKGWIYYEFCGHGNPFWWDKMLADTLFTQTLQCRWQQLRMGVLHLDSLYQFIDQNANLLTHAQQRNFKKYPIWGRYVWPNPMPLANSYEQEISYLKEWIAARLTWIDTQLLPTNDKLPTIVAHTFENTNQQVVLCTNPTNKQTNLYCVNMSMIKKIQLLSAQDGLIWQIQSTENNIIIPTQCLPIGLYWIQLSTPNGVFFTKLVKK